MMWEIQATSKAFGSKARDEVVVDNENKGIPKVILKDKGPRVTILANDQKRLTSAHQREREGSRNYRQFVVVLLVWWWCGVDNGGDRGREGSGKEEIWENLKWEEVMFGDKRGMGEKSEEEVC
ncbi:hypothetical protein KIW84_072227 [Lathyrus oleraceus]|uniref:Uncharacterized protein n=1 Tax=Pisum sativum TaxID=3888 RepID=A0A9D4VKQ0_PEA|nr:hypothetical protein KIW84_072227 [Pisum sativum]